jgi:hypothetical protein
MTPGLLRHSLQCRQTIENTDGGILVPRRKAIAFTHLAAAQTLFVF